MKQKVSVLLVFVLMMVFVIPAYAQEIDNYDASNSGFTDVSENDWYHEAVSFVTDHDLFNGVTETKFAPNESMTRAMFVQVLANQTENYEAPKEDALSLFRDVKKTDWHYHAVQWAAENGIVKGTGDGYFSPDKVITREEMVKMLFQYALVTGESTSIKEGVLNAYSDKNQISNWAQAPFGWAVSNGIISGTGAELLAPKDNALRAHTANMFKNAHAVMTKRKLIVAQEEANNPNKAFLEMLSMSYEKLADGKAFEPIAYDDDGSYEGQGGTSIYKGFAKNPEVKVSFYGAKALSEQYPDYLIVNMEDIFPEIVGKNVGEIHAQLNGIADFTSYNASDGKAYFDYFTKNYRFIFEVDQEKLTVYAKTPVQIYYRPQTPALSIPDNATLTYRHNGRDIFTITLPESWKKCKVTQSAWLKNEPKYLGFYEPLTNKRYEYRDGRLLMLYLQDSEKEVYYPLYEKLKTVEYESKTYDIIAIFPSDIRYAPDDEESVEAYQAMRADIHDVMESVKVCDGIKDLS